MMMIALPSLRYLVSFIKNSPKKKRNSHPGYSGTALRKLIKMYPHRTSLKQFYQTNIFLLLSLSLQQLTLSNLMVFLCSLLIVFNAFVSVLHRNQNIVIDTNNSTDPWFYIFFDCYFFTFLA